MDKQIHLYGVDTSIFYYPSENRIHEKLLKGYMLRGRIRKRRNKIHKQYNRCNTKSLEKDVKYIDDLYLRVNKILNKLKDDLYIEFEKNKGNIRNLNTESLSDKKVISLFDSALTRTIGAKVGELTDELIIVQAFFFEILEDIILNGFTWNNEKYIVYTASAGQIRTKKTVFIKESTYKKYENALTCGLTDELINERGKININKYLAYKALQNSATDKWLEFDINKAIVVKDFETEVEALVDFIDDKTYKITRKTMNIPIPHTDGAGMMLPSFCNKNRMVRLPWVKGLLVPFDFKEFLYRHIEKDKVNYAVIKDLYGKEYDIIKDDIQVIFTESQFKMHSYYNGWDEYKNKFKKYNCQACYCSEEEDYIKNARINYQMLQTLTEITDDELMKISRNTNDDITKITNDKKTMMKLMNVTKENISKDYYQQAIQYYPPLLNDSYSKDILRQKKRSTVKRAKSGKLFIDAKYTYICPDMYAFSENLFLGIDTPNGLLKKDEVSCSLYNHGEELDCLRSPHLFLEHAIRKNNVSDVHKKWFITKGLYTSVNDTISKILQFDCDGDNSLVCSDKIIIDAAKRSIEKYDVVPLYYDMKTANKSAINNQTIYDGLTLAYKGGNIGIISNDISKIWNSGDVDIDAIKLLCMENNYVIDFAKTLYKPKRPKWAKDKIVKYTKKKLPHFFKYAKDKTSEGIEEINDSAVNKLDNIIVNPNLKFKSVVGRFYYKKLMNNPDYEPIEKDSEIIGAYEEYEHKSVFMINRSEDYSVIENAGYVYGKIKKQILDVCNDPVYVTDVLIHYLYKYKKEDKKITLWECFGDIIVENIKKNVTRDFKYEAIECEECGILIEKDNPNRKYCDECWDKRQKESWKEASKKYRDKQKS